MEDKLKASLHRSERLIRLTINCLVIMIVILSVVTVIQIITGHSESNVYWIISLNTILIAAALLIKKISLSYIAPFLKEEEDNEE